MTAGTNHFTINRMKMSEKSGKISRVSQSTQNMMKKQQNMKKLRHEVWDEKEGMYIKSGLPEETKLKIRMWWMSWPTAHTSPTCSCP